MAKKTKHDIETLGKLAIELIANYPLYARTSGITYQEAILLAMVLYPNTKEWAKIVEEM